MPHLGENNNMDCPVYFELFSGFLALFHLPRDDLGGLSISVIKHGASFSIYPVLLVPCGSIYDHLPSSLSHITAQVSGEGGDDES